MKIFFILFFIFVISCSGEKELIDIDAFTKQGKKLNFDTYDSLINKNISVINKLKVSNFYTYKSWNQEGYNSENLLYPSEVQIDKILHTKNGNFLNILNFRDNIISIDKKSTITIYDLNLKTIKKNKIYKRKIYKNYNLEFNLAIKNNRLLVTDNLGNIHCYDLENLKLVWSKNLTVPFVSDVKIYKENLYIINSNSKIFSINVESGKINWSYETASKEIKDKQSYQIAIFNNYLFFTNDHGEIYSIDLNKKDIAWSKNLKLQKLINQPLNFVPSRINIDKAGILYLSSNYGYTYAINHINGETNWSMPVILSKPIFLSSDKLISFHDNRILILNKNSGKILLNKKIYLPDNKTSFSINSFLLGKKYIYFFTNTNLLIRVDYNDLKSISYEKIAKNFKNFLILRNNLYILFSNAIIKY